MAQENAQQSLPLSNMVSIGVPNQRTWPPLLLLCGSGRCSGLRLLHRSQLLGRSWTARMSLCPSLQVLPLRQRLLRLLSQLQVVQLLCGELLLQNLVLQLRMVLVQLRGLLLSRSLCSGRRLGVLHVELGVVGGSGRHERSTRLWNRPGG